MKTIIIDGVEYNLTPKAIFKKGDWVACNQELCFESPLCIKDIDNNNYRVESVDGCSGVPTINYLDNYYHLYTIKDVKDGDVLVYEGEIFIIKFYVLWHKIVYHCCYDGKNLHKYSIYDSWRKEDFDKVHPANKEQRDTLFAKMKESGYEWNTEKKELKKIEQKTSKYGGYCEGCNNVKGCVTCVDGDQWAHYKEVEQNPARSEEDEEMLDSIIDCIDGTGLLDFDQIDWLKSLKDRI